MINWPTAIVIVVATNCAAVLINNPSDVAGSIR
jgi:hypothetical protein